MDSPGHSAQYCTYTFMENETHKILCVVTMDKRMTGRKSAILEKACFQKGLQFLFEKGLHVVEVVTDAHVQVEALMSKCLEIHCLNLLVGYRNTTTCYTSKIIQ